MMFSMPYTIITMAGIIHTNPSQPVLVSMYSIAVPLYIGRDKEKERGDIINQKTTEMRETIPAPAPSSRKARAVKNSAHTRRRMNM